MPNDPKTVVISKECDLVNIDGVEYFSLGNFRPLVNDCAGKPNGTPCGDGCTCKAGQPVYTLAAIQEFGFQVAKVDKNDDFIG